MISGFSARCIAILLLLLATGSMPASGQEDESFMPRGAKTLLLQVAMPDLAAELREIANIRRTETEWRSFVSERHKQLGEREAAELAAYLSVNFPLPEGVVEQGVAQNDIASALPADGRELAWTQCQFCHSLFTGYLMQQRDVQGWRSIFLSPFHKNLKMTPQQRETFAHYSAINMPMKAADVPAALRY
jgi:mono/diheme cytochrome c family protein